MSVSFLQAAISSTSYTADPTFTVPFIPKQILITLDGEATVPVLVSFDGTNDDGRVEVEIPKSWGQRVTRVWLRQAESGDALTAYLEAED